MSSSVGPDLPFLWEEHLRHEFETKNTEETLMTMVEDAYVNHVPVMTGGYGKSQLRQFYSTHFIPQMPDDTQIIPISRTVGEDRLVEEFVFKFTHDIQMDWMLPGIPPTGKQVEIPVVQFHEDKLAHEHIYWDQAGVLVWARPCGCVCIGLTWKRVVSIFGLPKCRMKGRAIRAKASGDEKD